jgi:FixJ family two-component response regulator
MDDAHPSVLVIDDDPEFRDSVARLLRTIGLHTRQFSSVLDFLKADPPEGPTCIVLEQVNSRRAVKAATGVPASTTRKI